MREKKMILPALLLTLCACLFSGCQNGIGASQTTADAGDSDILVFYENSSGTAAETIGYNLTSEGDDAIQELFGILQNGQFTDGTAAVPAGVVLTQSAWQEHSLALYLEGDYPDVGTNAELLCRYAIVETLFQLPDVEGVTIYLNGLPLRDKDGLEIGTMTVDSFLGDAASFEGDAETVSQKIYYADGTGTSLKSCETTVTKNSIDTMERQIVEKLIAGPSDSSCTASVPSGTKILGIKVYDGICYLNLSSEFAEDEMDISNVIRIYSIVNSLTELQEINSVQIMINGAADYDFGEEISIAVPLKKNTEYISE